MELNIYIILSILAIISLINIQWLYSRSTSTDNNWFYQCYICYKNYFIYYI